MALSLLGLAGYYVLNFEPHKRTYKISMSVVARIQPTIVCSLMVMVMVCMCVLTDGDGVYVCAH